MAQKRHKKQVGSIVYPGFPWLKRLLQAAGSERAQELDKRNEDAPVELAEPLPAPYPPSWVDRLIEGIRRSRFPAWASYVGLGLAVYLFITAITWLERSVPLGLLPLTAYDGAGYVVIYIALIHYLDTTATRALDHFQPFLDGVEEDTLERLRYELTTLPANGAWVAVASGLAFTAIGLLFLRLYGTGHLVPQWPSQLLSLFLGNLFFATFLYHTVHQLHSVNRIHAATTGINLFQREPAYAFSRLTARTAAAWVLAFMLGVVPRISLELGTLLGPYGPVAWYPMLTAALLAFVLPLLGMRRLLQNEKQRLQRQANLRLEQMLSSLNTRIDAENVAGAGDFKVLLDSLLLERDLLRRIPTWPWDVNTLAGYLSTVLLPLLIWFMQQMLGRLFAGNP